MIETNLSRAIKTSVAIHIALLAFLYLKSIISPSTLNTKEYIPSLRVDLVALPNQKITEQVTPPKPVESEPVKEKTEPEVKQKPVVDAGDYSLKKNKNKEKKERLKSALERIKAIQKITESEEVKGNKISKGSSATGQAPDSADTTYFDTIHEKVQDQWELPQWLKDQNLSAKVLIKIDRRGLIVSTNFVQSSGNQQFDTAVKQALQAAAPFPNPPESVLSRVSQDGILLKFPL